MSTTLTTSLASSRSRTARSSPCSFAMGVLIPEDGWGKGWRQWLSLSLPCQWKNDVLRTVHEAVAPGEGAGGGRHVAGHGRRIAAAEEELRWGDGGGLVRVGGGGAV